MIDIFPLLHHGLPAVLALWFVPGQRTRTILLWQRVVQDPHGSWPPGRYGTWIWDFTPNPTGNPEWVKRLEVAFEDGDGDPMLIWFPGWNLDVELILQLLPDILAGECEQWAQQVADDLWEDGAIGEDEEPTPQQLLARWPHREPREGWIGKVDGDEPGQYWVETCYRKGPPSNNPHEPGWVWSQATIVEAKL